MPYNKGDFTQQGVDGKVCGGLLLNNKRDVDVLVTTNEDDSTLGAVAVTVEDHLNDLKYAFFGTDLEAGEVYEIGGGGESPIVYIKVNITNDNTTYDLYDYGTYPNRSEYFTDAGSYVVYPYYTTINATFGNPVSGAGNIIAEKKI